MENKYIITRVFENKGCLYKKSIELSPDDIDMIKDWYSVSYGESMTGVEDDELMCKIESLERLEHGRQN